MEAVAAVVVAAVAQHGAGGRHGSAALTAAAQVADLRVSHVRRQRQENMFAVH